LFSVLVLLYRYGRLRANRGNSGGHGAIVWVGIQRGKKAGGIAGIKK
jgi:hypothetical protein